VACSQAVHQWRGERWGRGEGRRTKIVKILLVEENKIFSTFCDMIFHGIKWRQYVRENFNGAIHCHAPPGLICEVCGEEKGKKNISRSRQCAGVCLVAFLV
jgi:hypothetical protein